MFKICNATNKEIPQIIDMQKCWYNEWNYTPPDNFYQVFEDTILGLLKSNTESVKVAYENNAVVGYAIGCSKLYNESGICLDVVFDVGYIFEVYVKHEFRKKGIAKALLDSLEKHFKESGKKSIFGITYDWNKEAQMLADSCGWKLSGHTYSKNI
jgi:ribosomal protein S18 acetylase RimI-like enzyme